MYTIFTQVLYFSRAAEFEPHGHRITSKITSSHTRICITTAIYYTSISNRPILFLNFLPLSLILLIIQNNNSLLSPKEDYINYHKLSPPPSTILSHIPFLLIILFFLLISYQGFENYSPPDANIYPLAILSQYRGTKRSSFQKFIIYIGIKATKGARRRVVIGCPKLLIMIRILDYPS